MLVESRSDFHKLGEHIFIFVFLKPIIPGTEMLQSVPFIRNMNLGNLYCEHLVCEALRHATSVLCPGSFSWRREAYSLSFHVISMPIESIRSKKKTFSQPPKQESRTQIVLISLGFPEKPISLLIKQLCFSENTPILKPYFLSKMGLFFVWVGSRFSLRRPVISMLTFILSQIFEDQNFLQPVSCPTKKLCTKRIS